MDTRFQALETRTAQAVANSRSRPRSRHPTPAPRAAASHWLFPPRSTAGTCAAFLACVALDRHRVQTIVLTLHLSGWSGEQEPFLLARPVPSPPCYPGNGWVPRHPAPCYSIASRARPLGLPCRSAEPAADRLAEKFQSSNACAGFSMTSRSSRNVSARCARTQSGTTRVGNGT